MARQRRQLLIALFCALGATAALFAYTSSISSQAQTERLSAMEEYGGLTAQVVVTTQAVGAGERLDDSNTRLMEWLVDLLPTGKVATAMNQVAGQVAAVDLHANEPVPLDRIGDGSSRINVPKGLEAVSVASDDVLAVGGAIRAGSFVDVYVETATGGIVPLGERILVLETNGTREGEEGEKAVTWVTLAVTPESVAELIQASTKGAIHLALPSEQGGRERAR